MKIAYCEVSVRPDNSVNHTDYDNPDDLEVYTLENAIYISMKNDVLFLFDCT